MQMAMEMEMPPLEVWSEENIAPTVVAPTSQGDDCISESTRIGL